MNQNLNFNENNLQEKYETSNSNSIDQGINEERKLINFTNEFQNENLETSIVEEDFLDKDKEQIIDSPKLDDNYITNEANDDLNFNEKPLINEKKSILEIQEPILESSLKNDSTKFFLIGVVDLPQDRSLKDEIINGKLDLKSVKLVADDVNKEKGVLSHFDENFELNIRIRSETINLKGQKRLSSSSLIEIKDRVDQNLLYINDIKKTLTHEKILNILDSKINNLNDDINQNFSKIDLQLQNCVNGQNRFEEMFTNYLSETKNELLDERNLFKNIIQDFHSYIGMIPIFYINKTKLLENELEILNEKLRTLQSENSLKDDEIKKLRNDLEDIKFNSENKKNEINNLNEITEHSLNDQLIQKQVDFLEDINILNKLLKELQDENLDLKKQILKFQPENKNQEILNQIVNKLKRAYNDEEDKVKVEQFENIKTKSVCLKIDLEISDDFLREKLIQAIKKINDQHPFTLVNILHDITEETNLTLRTLSNIFIALNQLIKFLDENDTNLIQEILIKVKDFDIVSKYETIRLALKYFPERKIKLLEIFIRDLHKLILKNGDLDECFSKMNSDLCLKISSILEFFKISNRPIGIELIGELKRTWLEPRIILKKSSFL
ncbi:unnamed protein product [Brachionus calyciflorus]|uniref:Uncharacterized protein n=1 Tax=Brachionus calyciflorus TaxID=104777 RepID=A0A813LZJ9_9BILA|nr:unnamed protein product [Brachionus calyciflorus]